MKILFLTLALVAGQTAHAQVFPPAAGGGGSGDIEGVTAGNGISGGGTSGTVTVTNAAPLYGCTDTGGDDAYVCAPTGFPVAYATGQTLLITFTTANTGAATIDAGPGAKAIKLPGGSSDPATGDIVALKPMLVRYDETANGAAGGWILAGTACGTGLACTGGTPAVDPTQVGFLGTANTWSATQTFVAPALGTPASGVATNLTGLPTAGLVNNAVTSAKLAVVNTRHVCDIGIGDTSGSALTNAQLGPQKRGCFIPAAATVVEVDVAADAGTPNVIVGRNVAGTQANILSAALATAASGGIACSKTSAVTGIDGATTCSATLQNTALAAGSYLELVSGTAGGTAKWMTVHVIYTID